MTPDDIDRAVWTAVKKGDRAGTVISPGVIYARTGTRLTPAECNQAVDRLVAAGNLYWRGQTVHRRLLAGPTPHPPAAPPPQDDLLTALPEAYGIEVEGQ